MSPNRPGLQLQLWPRGSSAAETDLPWKAHTLHPGHYRTTPSSAHSWPWASLGDHQVRHTVMETRQGLSLGFLM